MYHEYYKQQLNTQRPKYNMTIKDSQQQGVDQNYLQFEKTLKCFLQKNHYMTVKQQLLTKQFYQPEQKYLLKMKFMNNNIKLVLTMNIQKFWNKITTLGFNIIRYRLNQLNNQYKSLIFVFCEVKKQISIKMASQYVVVNRQILLILQQCLLNMQRHLLNEQIQLQEKYKVYNFSLILQQKRKERLNFSQVSLSFKNFKVVVNEEPPDQKEKQQFEGIKQDRIYQLKQRYKKLPNILQAIEVQDQNLPTQLLKGGSNSIVQKFFGKYKISPNLSINAQTNQMLFKEKVKNIEQKIQKQSYLVRKTCPVNELSMLNYFQLQIQLLKIIRGQKCGSINNFYFRQIQINCSIPSKTYIYSEYHECVISHQSKVVGVEKYLKIMYTLCQGLVFLQWNGISHRDLKPDNILMDEHWSAKIIDFGSACHNRLRRMKTRLKRVSQLSTNAAYNLRWSKLQPQVKKIFINSKEYYETHQYFDVYAYGKIMQNILLNHQNKLQLGTQVWDYLQYLSRLCQQQNPEDRPSPTHIYVFFTKILQIRNGYKSKKKKVKKIK